MLVKDREPGDFQILERNLYSPVCSPPMITGNCLCGSVQFRIHGELPPIQVCYCGQCRKAQGTPLATNIPVPASAFELLSGAAALRVYVSSPGKERVFCGTCGSPVYSRRAGLSVLRLRAGLLNEPLTPALLHCQVGSKCNWWTIHDDGPQFQEGYEPDRLPPR